jgi:hypothetical protein
MRHSLPRVRLVFAALACALLTACAKVNDDTYAKIQDGMSLSKVQSILGEGEKEESAGTSISATGLAGASSSAMSKRQTYSWKDGDKQIVIEFVDDKVVSKRKIGF